MPKPNSKIHLSTEKDKKKMTFSPKSSFPHSQRKRRREVFVVAYGEMLYVKVHPKRRQECVPQEWERSF
jgi:hypothetical protein